jgi:putative DNA primase/helicase
MSAAITIQNKTNRNATDIVDTLGGNSKTGMCRCPAHDDKTPSLKVSTGANGKVLFKCHAGCAQDAVIAALKQRGLWPEQAKRVQPVSQAGLKRREREQEFEEYESMSRAWGILRVAKQTPKEARAKLGRYLRGRGIKSIPSNALLLPAVQSEALGIGPRFPAMVFPVVRGGKLIGAHVTWLCRNGGAKLATSAPRKMYGVVSGGFIQLGKIYSGKRLVVGEGIETVLSAAQLIGWPAVAAMSASNLTNVALPSRVTDVIIAADNDEAGRKAADEAARRFNSTGCRVRIAFPPDGHNDWNDALCSADDNADDLAKLRRAILRAPVFEGHIEAVIRPLGMGEFLNLDFPPRDFLLKPWLTTNGLAMIDANPGGGKTWLALSIGYSVASGKPLMDWTVERRARVLYVDGELPGALLQSRVDLLGPPLPASDFLILAYAEAQRREALMPDLGTVEGRALLDAIIEHNQIELIILDSVSTLVRSGVDNDVESWREIQAWSLKHRARGRAVIYLHHHGRSGQPRGTSSREIVLDARLKMTRDETVFTDTETTFKIEFMKNRDFWGIDAAPLLACLSTQTGQVQWRREEVRRENGQFAEIQRLSGEGMRDSQIADQLGLSRGRISQIRKKAREPV